MNTSEIKRRLAELLGKSRQSFASYKTTEGVEMKTDGDMFEIGQPVYIITPQGELPAEDGMYEMETGMKVKVKEGMIDEITDMVEEVEEPEMETEVEVEMVEATLVDGTKVMTEEGDFEPGKKLYVITEAGEKVLAPEGEHSTESGITLVVDAEGTITGVKKPEAEGEGSLATTEEVMDEFTKLVEGLMNEIKTLKNTQDELTEKFNKFAAEPAAERHFDRKSYFEEKQKTQFNKLQQLAKLKSNK